MACHCYCLILCVDGNFCRLEVELDSVMQDIPLNFSRGMNVVILDFLDGSVLETSVFDTHISGTESEEFTRMVEWLEVGAIVIILSKDDCSEHLTESAKQTIEELGSRHIRSLRLRDSWCCIAEKVCSESF